VTVCLFSDEIGDFRLPTKGGKTCCSAASRLEELVVDSETLSRLDELVESEIESETLSLVAVELVESETLSLVAVEALNVSAAKYFCKTRSY
jgi:hypothetical protein